MKLIFLSFLFIHFCLSNTAQNSVSFHSSNPALEKAFIWAQQTALSYRGKPGDSVGPWYESALPPRSAFCMRDVSHQSIGGEILGLSKENKNMLTLFVKNISAGKDWCSYWEMNKSGKPAPEDYRNDTAFWYNLNANFDVMNACWRLFLWTGDKAYINDPAFIGFHEKSVHEYIDKWVLQPDSLLSRPAHPNAPVPYNETDAFHRCRGLPSYSEGVPNLKMGVDLVAALCNGLKTYAAILWANGALKTDPVQYLKKAQQYQQHIERYWWDGAASQYHTYITNDGVFGKGEGETFLLWFDALRDSMRTAKTIEHLVSQNLNVENLSYFPYILSRFGYPGKAYEYILHLSDPSTPRREYPEVSFGVIEGIVQGLMGIDADARKNLVSTLFSGGESETLSIENLPVLGGSISVMEQKKITTLENKGKRPVTWRIKFQGKYSFIKAGDKKIKVTYETDMRGNDVSFADIQVSPAKKIQAIPE